MSLTWSRDILAKVDYIEQSYEGLKIHCHKVEKEKKMNKLQGEKVDKIEIVRSGDTVIARAFQEDGKLYHDLYVEVKKGYLLINEAAAKCGPNDIFDFNIGAKLAFDRLYEGYDMTPKPKRKPLNGKIIVVWNEEVYDTFTVRDGKIESMLYVLRCPCQQKDTIYEDSSFEEMKQALLNCASFVWYSGKSPKAICRDYDTYHK